MSLPLQREEQGSRHLCLPLIPDVSRRADSAVIRGVVYFCLVFGVGFILGTIRVLWVVPILGERMAELLEAPLMLAATYFAARFITRRFSASRRVEYLYSGLVALIILLFSEVLLVVVLLGASISEYVAAKDPVAGVAYAVMLIIFAGMPWLVGKERAAV